MKIKPPAHFRKGLAFTMVSIVGLIASDPEVSDTIRRLPLNPWRVTVIPVGQGSFTTLRFPGPYSELGGLGLSTNESGWFQVLTREGSPTIAVRALGSNVTAQMTVAYRSQSHVFVLIATNRPWSAVSLEPPPRDPPPTPTNPPPAKPMAAAVRPKEPETPMKPTFVELTDARLRELRDWSKTAVRDSASEAVTLVSGEAFRLALLNVVYFQSEQVAFLRLKVFNRQWEAVTVHRLALMYQKTPLPMCMESYPSRISGRTAREFWVAVRVPEAGLTSLKPSEFVVETLSTIAAP